MTFHHKKLSRYNPDSYSSNIASHAGALHLTMPAPKYPPCAHGNFHHWDLDGLCTVCGVTRVALEAGYATP